MIQPPVRVAAVQMIAAAEVAENLEAAARLVQAAAIGGAQLVALPENAAIMGRNERDKIAVREDDGAGPIQAALASIARENKVWLVAGTIPLAARDPGKVRAACLVFDPSGRRIARYDKIHLFGFEQGAERYAEANTIEAGDTPCAIDTPVGRLGLSVCYDVRFPELYRSLGLCDMLFVPSAFTVTTGRAHWEILLRARAIENQCYLLAPAQGGVHANGRETHGHTMIIDPWGTVLAMQAKGEGVVYATIDPAELRRVRTSLPALEHRVLR
jgi:predicted amidohydrolase